MNQDTQQDFTTVSLVQRRDPKIWTKCIYLLPRPPVTMLSSKDDEFHYKKEEFQWLPPAHFEVIMRLIEFRTGKNLTMDQAWFDALTTEELNDDFLNMWRPCEGCLPNSEVGDDLLADITEKFRTPLDVVCNMAEIIVEHKVRRGDKLPFHPVPLVESSFDESTYYAIVDWDRHIRYLFGYDKAWIWKWHSLTAFANWVLACSIRTVQVFQALKDIELKLKNIRSDVRLRDGSETHEFDGSIIIRDGK